MKRIVGIIVLLHAAYIAAAAHRKYMVVAPTAEIPVGIETKIVGGQPAPPHSHPHQVSLQFMHPTTKSWYHFCGGSILDERTVLTAAHCVKGFEQFQCRVDAGDHDLAKHEGSEQVFDYWPHEQFYHPLYDGSTIDYDYAIIKLPSALQFNDKVMPVQLPEEDSNPSIDCWSSGWGNVRGDGVYNWPSVLQQAPTPLADMNTCTENYKTIEFGLTERMVCAGGIDVQKTNGTYEGICQGDSGGPLVCKDNSGVKRLVGVTSFSTNPCGQEFPGGYARVSKALLWITTYMERK